MTRRRVALSAAACAGGFFVWIGIVAAAQQPPAPTFRSGVDVLSLDVSVLDSQRRPVRGLTANDFTVVVEGKPRPIVAFSEVELPARPVASHSASWLATVPSDLSTNDVAPDGRLLVIVFDHSIEFDHLDRARRAAVAAVEALRPNDLAAIAFTDGFTHVNTVQGFTADKARLLEVISRPFIFAPEILDSVSDLPSTLSTSASCYCNICAFDKIGEVADLLANVTGRRKTVLFIGYATPDPFPSPLKLDPCTEPIIQARKTLEAHIARANLTVHVVDPSGGQPPATGFATRGRASPASTNGEARPYSTNEGLTNPAFARQQHLRFFADLTRARFAYEDNEPERAVPAMIEETTAYYLVAIQVSPDEAKDRASRLEVKVRGKNLIVQGRTAYRASDTNAAVEASVRSKSLVDSVNTPLPRSDQRLTLTAMSFANPGQRLARVAVVLRAEPSKANVSVRPSDPATASDETVTGILVALDRSGRVVASKKHAGAVMRAGGAGTPSAYEVLTALDLEPGRYDLRAALETSRGDRSSVYGFIDVPQFDKAPLTLSAIALSVQPAPMAAPKTAFAEFLPVVPTAQRLFTKSDLVNAFVRVYRGRPNSQPTSLATRLVDANDRVVFEEREDQVAEDFDTMLPIRDLPSGEYLLTFTATAGTDRAVQQLRFTVN